MIAIRCPVCNAWCYFYTSDKKHTYTMSTAPRRLLTEIAGRVIQCKNCYTDWHTETTVSETNTFFHTTSIIDSLKS